LSLAAIKSAKALLTTDVAERMFSCIISFIFLFFEVTRLKDSLVALFASFFCGETDMPDKLSFWKHKKTKQIMQLNCLSAVSLQKTEK
jgi:hypothetical protein